MIRTDDGFAERVRRGRPGALRRRWSAASPGRCTTATPSPAPSPRTCCSSTSRRSSCRGRTSRTRRRRRATCRSACRRRSTGTCPSPSRPSRPCRPGCWSSCEGVPGSMRPTTTSSWSGAVRSASGSRSTSACAGCPAPSSSAAPRCRASPRGRACRSARWSTWPAGASPTQLRAARTMPQDHPIGQVTVYRDLRGEHWHAPPGRELVAAVLRAGQRAAAAVPHRGGAAPPAGGPAARRRARSAGR